MIAPPQYSPDGRWWWNGSGWLPAPPPPGAPTAPWTATPAVRYAGFWLRLMAYVMDAIVINVVAIPLNLLLFHNAGARCVASNFIQISGNSSIRGVTYSCSPTGAGFLIYLVLGLAYFTLMWSRGSTLGQRVLQIRIVDAGTGKPLRLQKCVVRFIGFYLSALPLAIGLIWSAFDPRKRGWHDKMANSVALRGDDTQS